MPLLDPVIERVLADFEKRAEEEHRRTSVPGSPGANLDDLLLSVGREAGTLLYLLATGAQSRRILELGPRSVTFLSLSPRVLSRSPRNSANSTASDTTPKTTPPAGM